MEVEVRSESRKIQSFSRFARAACVCVMIFMGLGFALLVLGLVFGFDGVKVGFGVYRVATSHLDTPFLRAWSVIFVGVIFALVFRWLFCLWALFDNLAAGGIYTKENVRRIRQIGLLMLIMPVVSGVMVLLSLLILKVGLISEAAVIHESLTFTAGTAISLLAPALILLASWIMEVGRRTQEEANELRRDAELVV
jgi:hypothetical protein